MAVFDRENYFRDLLAKQVGGRVEVPLAFGRADVMTDEMVWEVEPASRYPAGVRQALHYGAMSGLPAAIATYGPPALVTKIYRRLVQLPAPGVELWWLHERRFVPIKSADDAERLAKDARARVVPLLSDSLPCEVAWQDNEVMRTCEAEPVVWTPTRLCSEHLEQLDRERRWDSPFGNSVDRAAHRDNPNGWWNSASDLKTAEDLVLTVMRLAWPNLEPDGRDLLSAYLMEVRSVIWGSAIRQPGYAKAWGDDEYEDEPLYPDQDTRMLTAPRED